MARQFSQGGGGGEWEHWGAVQTPMGAKPQGLRAWEDWNWGYRGGRRTVIGKTRGTVVVGGVDEGGTGGWSLPKGGGGGASTAYSTTLAE